MIKVGDLVQVVRWTCCEGRLGYIFRVERIRNSTSNSRCGFCKIPLQALVAIDDEDSPFPTQWLKRIDPLPESEVTKEREEMKV